MLCPPKHPNELMDINETVTTQAIDNSFYKRACHWRSRYHEPFPRIGFRSALTPTRTLIIRIILSGTNLLLSSLTTSAIGAKSISITSFRPSCRD